MAVRDALERLPDRELEIMIILWETREPVALPQISQKLRGKRKDRLTTTLASLARLTAKGYVQCTCEGKRSCYTAEVSEQQFLKSESQEIYRTNFTGLVYPKRFDSDA
jgi:BlaI family penicillinase repressor